MHRVCSAFEYTILFFIFLAAPLEFPYSVYNFLKYDRDRVHVILGGYGNSSIQLYFSSTVERGASGGWDAVPDPVRGSASGLRQTDVPLWSPTI